MRKLIKDFTHMDVVYMIPKLRIILREAVFNKALTSAKDSSAGYNHSYFDTRQINLANLATFPSSEAMNDLADLAYTNIESLFSYCGLDIDALDDDIPNIGYWKLPGVMEIVGAADNEVERLGMDGGDVASADEGWSGGLLEDSDDSELHEYVERDYLQEVQDEGDSTFPRLPSTDNRLDSLASAMAVVNLDSVMDM
jgi:hypothetical protein